MTVLSPAAQPAPVALSKDRQPVGIALIGFGTVGGGVYKLLADCPAVAVRRIVVRDVAKAKSRLTGPAVDLITDDVTAALSADDVDIVVEVAGGIEPARQWVETALRHGKHVVTANKALVATHGPALFALANAHNTRLMLEGAVAGGIPIILPLRQSLAANRIQEIAGILNGTTNYILTRMSEDGWDFATALKQAQDLGFAEADPTSDVEGHDAAYKIAILASLALNRQVAMDQVFMEGITRITPVDMKFAKHFGFVIRLVGLARHDGEALDVRVHPMLVPVDHPLAMVRNEYNAVVVRGSALGRAMFYGKGAGEMPTASAVTADILALVGDIQVGNLPVPAMAVEYEGPATILPMSETTNRYYLRLNTLDQPGVIAQLGKAFGDAGVSLESFWQQPGAEAGTASLILVTHAVKERQLQQALGQIEQLSSTQSVGCLLRVL